MSLILLLTRPTSSSSFVGALDNFSTGLQGAWSGARRLRSGYTGAVIRVRRSSDNSELDFSGSGEEGEVDTTAVASFCGAGNGFLTTIYDQSGNGRNFVQATTTRQPQVVAAGSAIQFNGRLTPTYSATAVKNMTVPSSTSIFNFLHGTGTATSFWMLGVNDTAGFKKVMRTYSGVSGRNGIELEFQNNEQLGLLYFSGDQICASRTIGSGFTGAQSLTIFSQLTVSPVSSRLVVYRNDTELTTASNVQTGTASNNASQHDYIIGSDSANGNGFDGWIGEHYVWNTIGSLFTDRSIYENNARDFYGI